MFYDIYCQLCESSNLTPSGAAAQIGFNRASVTVWKNTGKAPKQDLLLKIANFFGVTTDFLLTGDKKETAPALSEKDKRDTAKEVERIMDSLESGGDLMFDGVPMSPEAKESLAAAMKLGLEAARLRNKETYTPKKYRK
ncbi:helix-turn-helix domain-containing protein [Oscillibacter ruminantium]|uniref:helix-turn-helix domain-containing protein n=1 Tax=Oscillibacter ruminantium TaxID=1263547 RepID=UPI001FB12707|nr:helix-turn-helix transcriptional regulator [Oscillibacter ruminantium]